MAQRDAASESTRIVVVGDGLTDVWMYGYLSECQDGCDKFVEQRRTVTPGGAANAANCLRHWFCSVELFTQELRGTKFRYVTDGTIVFRHDVEVDCDCECERQAALVAVSTASAVLLSDYDKGFLTPEFVRELIATAKCPVVVDAKQRPAVYSGAVLKCNETYAALYPEVRSKPDTVVTRGDQFPEGFSPYSYPAVKCVNHVGAGDCFAAHLALALAHDFSLTDAVTVAHCAGRVYVQHPHNRPPQIQETIAEECSSWQKSSAH